MSRTNRRGVLTVAMLGMVVAGLCAPLGAWASAAEAAPPSAERVALDNGGFSHTNVICYTIALTLVGSCVAAAYAVGKIGAAAMAASSEKPELIGRTIIFVGLAEGIAIYGLIVAIMLIMKL